MCHIVDEKKKETIIIFCYLLIYCYCCLLEKFENVFKTETIIQRAHTRFTRL